MKKMNILLITTDQHRAEYLGFLNKVGVNTPNLDKLAAGGAYHTNAYSVDPVCMPARCSILTGLYAHQTGMVNNRGDLNPFLNTLPKAMQKQGYHTSIIGKEHFYEGCVDLTKTREHSKKNFGFDIMATVAGKSMAAQAAEDDWTYYLKEKGLLDKYRKMARHKMADRKNGLLPGPGDLSEEDTVDFFIKEKFIDFINDYDSEKPYIYMKTDGGKFYTRIGIDPTGYSDRISVAIKRFTNPAGSRNLEYDSKYNAEVSSRRSKLRKEKSRKAKEEKQRKAKALSEKSKKD